MKRGIKMAQLCFFRKDIDRIEDFIMSNEFINNLVNNLEFNQTMFVLQTLSDAVKEAKEHLNGAVH
jgi:hypothetical protein